MPSAHCRCIKIPERSGLLGRKMGSARSLSRLTFVWDANDSGIVLFTTDRTTTNQTPAMEKKNKFLNVR